MKRLTERLKVIGKKLPKALLLAFFLLGALLLDAVAYGFFNTCKACTSYSQCVSNVCTVINQCHTPSKRAAVYKVFLRNYLLVMPAFISRHFFIPKTPHFMVVDHADCLHKSINDSRTHKIYSSFF